MPIYEYECAKCGEVFEVMQAFSAEPLKKHKTDESDCGGKVAKIMSANAFHLKGGGWYKDGYAKPAQKKESATPPCGAGGCGAGACSTN